MFDERRIFSLDFKENFISTREKGSFAFLCSAEGEFFFLIIRRNLFPFKRMEVSYFSVLQKENFFS